MDERRQFSRVSFANQAQVKCKDKVWQTTLFNISLNGALIELPPQFAPSSQQLQLSFFIADSDIQVHMDTQLVHQKDNLLGLACSHIDVESISHLRRLIELNVGDPSLLDRELALFIDTHNQGK
ncbi:PilZ domain-containing protein [Shewanella sp. Choline-02u-19]|jgi:c-di-GMP-binding flagellar brake protein YcgR|uniref:PilZ domain-containing protein n=1 Tax=unclassified Shewanella TaxID=196818 RepID=UPI000C338348|nr:MULTISPECIES: PilZ domain-containing protein [unclassified Shewanella]PKG75082.1 PilZ domain-containing protein [Shewanella sp. GutCb]PKH58525.1 PilZ domain-containing protein [Shewanella sp. Bg11-22]PKI26599.1 PilZ domain-containing protein [Shewanella sp. Choline-02u-19]